MANLIGLERSVSCLRDGDDNLKTREIDRISGLPNDVVSHVLSFLTTKDAVATSILSKRWRSLWTLAPNLVFSSWSSKETESFLRFFLERVKPLHKSFGVVTLQGEFGDHLADWFNEIVACSVRELNVAVLYGEPTIFYHGSLISKTLVSLKLEGISFDGPLFVHLPCLKILHLWRVGNMSEESMSQFISGCPALEDILLGKYSEGDTLKLPPILFTSQTLVSLKLGSGISFDFPSPILLPHLKSLIFLVDKNVNDECISQFLSGCTSLEYMLLRKYDGDPLRLPYNLFSSKTLVSLKLSGMIFFHVPLSIHLPCLKILLLGTVQIMHSEFLRDFFSGCPLLEDLSFKNYNLEPIKLPYNLFISKTLVSLKLDGKISFHVPSSVHLPRLKIFHLGRVETPHDVSLRDFLSGCPSLEEMALRDSVANKIKSSSICVRTLKRLKIDLWSSYPPCYEFDIVAPALRYLKVRCKDFNGEMAWNFPNLVVAFVGFSYQTPKKLLSAVQDTKFLELNPHAYGDRQLPVSIDFIPKFQNLECLEISDFITLGSYLPEILENCDNLQKLTVTRKSFDDSDVSWSRPQLVPHCLLHTLKAFGMRYIKGLNGEMQVVDYILTSAQVLERVTISFFILDRDQELCVQEKLSTIPRCSSTCELEFI